MLARHAAGEAVRFRQQRTFVRNFLDRPGERVVGQQASDHLLRGQSLRHGEGVLDNLTLDHEFDHVGDAGVLFEFVLAGFELAARLERDDAAQEDPRLVDHALALELFGDGSRAAAARDVDHLVFGERAGRVEALLAEE